MRWLSCRTVAWVLAVFPACAGPSYELRLKPYSVQAADYPLPSGLRILFVEDRQLVSLSVASVVDVGSTADPPGREGLAHLVEHLCFRATDEAGLSAMDRLKDLGAIFNASTSEDLTTFTTVVPTDALVPVLRMEALRMLDPLAGVTPETMGVEREVVRNELRWRTETHIEGRLFETIKERLFPSRHPYHRSGIGTRESLDAITLADATAFVRAHYLPRNVTIVVSGPVDRAQAVRLLEQAFPPDLVFGPGQPPGHIVATPPPPRMQGAPEEPPSPAETAPITLRARVANPLAVLAWSLPGASDDDWTTLMTVAMTEAAIANALYPESLYDADRAERIDCGLAPGRHASLAICSIEVAPGQNTADLLSRSLDGLWRAWDTGAVLRQRRLVSHARAVLMAGLFRASAQSTTRSLGLARLAHMTGVTRYFSHSLQRLSDVDEGRMREMAYRYLTRDRAVKLLVEPQQGGGTASARDDGTTWPGDVFARVAGENARYLNLAARDIETTALALDAHELRTFVLPS